MSIIILIYAHTHILMQLQWFYDATLQNILAKRRMQNLERPPSVSTTWPGTGGIAVAKNKGLKSDELEMKWRWHDYDNDKTTVTMYYDAVHDALLFWCLLESFGDETQWTRHLPSVEAGWWPPMMKGSKWEPYGSNMIIYWFHMVIYEIIIDSIYWFHIVIIIMD